MTNKSPTEDLTHITGVVNRYFRNTDDAATGMAAMTEELYARKNEKGLWDVLRISAEPMLPEGVTLYDIKPLRPLLYWLVAGAPTGLFALASLPAYVKRDLSQDAALDLVRAHETKPALYETLPVLSQTSRPGNARTHWRTIANGPA